MAEWAADEATLRAEGGFDAPDEEQQRLDEPPVRESREHASSCTYTALSVTTEGRPYYDNNASSILSSSGVSCPVDSQTQGEQDHCTLNEPLPPQMIQIATGSNHLNRGGQEKYKRAQAVEYGDASEVEASGKAPRHTQAYSFGLGSGRQDMSRPGTDRHRESIQPCEGGTEPLGDRTAAGSQILIQEAPKSMSRSSYLHSQRPENNKDYLDQLRQLQKAGQIGALGQGTINFDQIKGFLERDVHSPSQGETRCVSRAELSEVDLISNG